MPLATQGTQHKKTVVAQAFIPGPSPKGEGGKRLALSPANEDGTVDDVVAYIAMEFIDGVTLREKIHRAPLLNLIKSA